MFGVFLSTFSYFTEIGDLGVSNGKGFTFVLNVQQHITFPTLGFLQFLLCTPLFMGVPTMVLCLSVSGIPYSL